MKKIEYKVLIACEFSGTTRREFRKLGYDAYSCDLIPAEDKSPHHLVGDVRKHLEKKWHLIIAHPPCTHLTVSGAKHFKEKREDGRQQKGIDFFLQFTQLECELVAIENPIGIMSSLYRKPSQIIQPWEYGHPEKKATCLWLKNLPLLRRTNIVPEELRKATVHEMLPGVNRSRKRSKSYSGISEAMALQWSKTMEKEYNPD